MTAPAPAPARTVDLRALRRVADHGMFWPVVALLVLLVACGLKSPGFLDVTLRDGHLFGQLIDMLRNH